MKTLASLTDDFLLHIGTWMYTELDKTVQTRVDMKHKRRNLGNLLNLSEFCQITYVSYLSHLSWRTVTCFTNLKYCSVQHTVEHFILSMVLNVRRSILAQSPFSCNFL